MTTLNQRLSKLSKDYKTFTHTTYLPTGSLIMDTVMGGGLPVGKVVELASDSGIGKTTVTLSMCRELLLQGKKIIYLDHEGAVSTSQLHGIFGKNPKTNEYYADEWLWDPENNPNGIFLLFQVTTYSQAEDVLNQTLGSGEFSLVVVDSVTSMVADEYLKEVENPDSKDGKDITDQRPAVDARYLGKFLKKFKAVCTRWNVSMILINQLRNDLSLTTGISTKKSTGGAAIEFFPDIRLRLEKPSPILQTRRNDFTGEEEKQQIGCTASIFAWKNKLAPCKIKIPISIIYGKGISNLYSYRNWLPHKNIEYNGEEVPILETRGGGYNILTLKDNRQFTARGEDALIQLIADHFAEIRTYFTADDFKITEEKAFAEFDEEGNRTFEIEPDSEFEVENHIVIDDDDDGKVDLDESFD